MLATLTKNFKSTDLNNNQIKPKVSITITAPKPTTKETK
jgi:hypothetical protein